MELNKDNIKKIILILAAAFLMLWAVINYQKVFTFLNYLLILLNPLIIGAAIAFILNVCVRSIENRLFRPLDKHLGRIWARVRRFISILLAIAFVLGVIVIITTMIVPEVKNAGKMLITEFPSYWSNLQNVINDLTSRFNLEEIVLPSLDINDENISEMLKNLIHSDMTNKIFNTALDMTTSVIGVTASVISVVFNSVMGIVFAIYILFRKEILAKQAKQILYAYLPRKAADEALYIARLSNTMFSKFVTGQCTEAVIIGLLCFLGMTIFKMPYAPMISVLVGFTALIPVFGAFIGTAIGAFLILMVSPIKALWFIIFIIVLQQVEGDLIYPKVVGSSIGLPGIWVMLAVIVGGSVNGVLGMLVSVPISAVLYCLIGRSAKGRLEKRNITIDNL